jgi:hypothetical protein
MDNVRIEINGYGHNLTIQELSDIQSNYIITHQAECNNVAPILNENNQLEYKTWHQLSGSGNFYGSTYDYSQLNIFINDTIYEINDFLEIKDSFNMGENKNYLMCINHLNGQLFNYEFNVDTFDYNKLSIHVSDLESLYWGKLICGVSYDGVMLTNTINEKLSGPYFENKIIRGGSIIPIQKL